MNRHKLEAEAQVILKRLKDRSSSLGFYCKCILILGFPRCYELSSIAIQKERDGEIKTSIARYFNGCVQKEVKDLGLNWNSRSYGK